MSYAVLRGLYYGETANADLTDVSVRSRLHVKSRLDELVPAIVSQGHDLVLTGNPGDGKSHLIATLLDRKALSDCEVVLDLSACPTDEVCNRWADAARGNRRLLMCANEGPLREFLLAATDYPILESRASELSSQLGRLTLTTTDEFPARPSEAWLIDLADRNVLEPSTVAQALERVCSADFLPSVGLRATDSSAGRNILLFADAEQCQERFSKLLVHAGRRLGEHITFRQLWACISFALTAGKSEATLRQELSRGDAGLGTYPLDHLAKTRARGALVEAARTYSDPVDIAAPDLDEEIWFRGEPRRGDWLFESPAVEPPERLWARGERQDALSGFESLKRLVALAHEEGEELLAHLGSHIVSPDDLGDDTLREETIVGIRRCFLTAEDEGYAPPWLQTGVPLWVGHTYRDVSPSERTYVAVESLQKDTFTILRPQRAPWLGDALGRPLPVAWLVHLQSGIRLRLDAPFVATLRQTTAAMGPLAPPDRVIRFLAMLAGWQERHDGMTLGRDHFGVLRRPREPLTTAANVIDLESGGAAYGAAEETRR